MTIIIGTSLGYKIRIAEAVVFESGDDHNSSYTILLLDCAILMPPGGIRNLRERDPCTVQPAESRYHYSAQLLMINTFYLASWLFDRNKWLCRLTAILLRPPSQHQNRLKVNRPDTACPSRPIVGKGFSIFVKLQPQPTELPQYISMAQK